LTRDSQVDCRATRRADPSLLPARAKRDDSLMPQIARVFDENFKVYGVRKVWRQLKRGGRANSDRSISGKSA